jgi:hypothetical protein
MATTRFSAPVPAQSEDRVSAPTRRHLVQYAQLLPIWTVAMLLLERPKRPKIVIRDGWILADTDLS